LIDIDGHPIMTHENKSLIVFIMSVYPQTVNPPSKTRKTERLSNVSKKARHLQNKSNSTKNPTITKLNSKFSSLPNWLTSFRFLQTSSSFVALCLIGTTLFLYGWTVYTQQTWGKQYKNLEHLQKQERDLTFTNETMKNTLAEDTNMEDSDLIPATPEKLVFINPSNKSKSELNKIQIPKNSAKIQPTLGY
jgi:hypothetical protein